MTPTADALTAARILKAWIRELEDEELRVDARELLADPDVWIGELDEARAILADPAMPLASEYPNGEPARPPYTPRQVRLLANAWGPPPVTHADPRYGEALAEVRRRLGRRGKRRCGGLTQAGDDCRGWALPYIKRARCGNHADAGERRFNRDMKAREEQMLHEELRKLGILDGSF